MENPKAKKEVKLMRASFSLPEPLVKELRIEAVKRGVRVSKLVKEALELYLRRKA